MFKTVFSLLSFLKFHIFYAQTNKPSPVLFDHVILPFSIIIGLHVWLRFNPYQLQIVNLIWLCNNNMYHRPPSWMNSKISNLGDFRMYKVIFSPVNDSIPVFFNCFSQTILIQLPTISNRNFFLDAGWEYSEYLSGVVTNFTEI